MHIFVDKLKEPKIVRFDKVIRSYEEFIDFIEQNEVLFISLGYELDQKFNAIDLITYLKNKNIHVPFINVHSSNNIAKNYIKKLIKKYFKETIITFIKEV